MSSIIRSGPGVRLSTLPAALAAAALLLTALAGSAAASEGQTDLRDPFVAPRVGTPGTVIRFSVTFQGQGDRSGARVSVVIDGVARAMAPALGGALASGIRYRTSTPLAVGTHTVAFSGSDGMGATAGLAAGTVRINRASSGAGTGGGGAGHGGSGTGTGGQTTTGGSSGGDTGGSAVSPTPAPGGSASGGTHDGAGSTTGSSTGGGQADHHDAPGPADHTTKSTGSSGPGAVRRPTAQPTHGGSDPVAQPSATPPADGLALGSIARPGADGSAGGSGGRGLDDGTWSVLTASRNEIGPAERMLLAAISTTTTATAAMAFFVFGKRRRDSDPPAPDEVLGSNAARLATTPASALIPGLGDTDAAGRADEAAMPRWRRPSLIEARRTDPLHSAAIHDRQSFDHATVATTNGAERRRIRYRAVSLLDAPDELRAAVIGELDEGDEVQLIERSGGYWFILCPDGSQGWVHRMTLGDVVVEESRAGAFNAARRSFAQRNDEPHWSIAADPADEPTGVDGADVGPDDADAGSDLLSAYLEKIHRP